MYAQKTDPDSPIRSQPKGRLERILANPRRLRLLVQVPVMSVVLALVGVGGWHVYQNQRREMLAQSTQAFNRVPGALESELEGEAGMMAATLEALADNDELAGLMRSGDREKLFKRVEAMYANLRSNHRMTHFYFHGPDRVCFLRVHSPKRHGDLINRNTAKGAEETQEICWGLELGPLGTFTLRVVRPWMHEGELIGYLELGEEIDHVLNSIHENQGVEFYAVIDKHFVDRKRWEEGMRMLGRDHDWDLLPSAVLIQDSLNRIPPRLMAMLKAGMENHPDPDEVVRLDGREYRLRFQELRDMAGKDVGELVLLRDETQQLAMLRNTAISAALVSVVLAGLLGAMFHLLLGKVASTLGEQFDRIEQANARLREEVDQRIAAEEQLTVLNQTLETQVEMRTFEVRQLLRQKDQFVNQLGHDLKTPLTPMVGLLPMVDSRCSDPEARRMLSLVTENVEYMRELVERTLVLARLNSPSFRLQCKPVNLVHLTRSCVAAMGDRFSRQGITVSNDVVEPIVFEADPLRMKEVLLNVLSNAVQAMPDGGTLTIQASQDTESVTLSIYDTGVGMTPEHAARAFEEFFKVDSSRHDRSSTGLGLSICRQVIDKHHGTIWLESLGLGEGASVHIVLPNAQPECVDESVEDGLTAENTA